MLGREQRPCPLTTSRPPVEEEALAATEGSGAGGVEEVGAEGGTGEAGPPSARAGMDGADSFFFYSHFSSGGGRERVFRSPSRTFKICYLGNKERLLIGHPSTVVVVVVCDDAACLLQYLDLCSAMRAKKESFDEC